MAIGILNPRRLLNLANAARTARAGDPSQMPPAVSRLVAPGSGMRIDSPSQYGGLQVQRPNPAAGAGAGGIVFPDRTNYSDTLGGIKSALGPVPTLGEVVSIPGFDQNYYDSLFNDARKNTEKTYFGEGGLQSRMVETLASRGLLGSSEETNQQRKLGGDFADQLATIGGDISRMKTENEIGDAREMRRLKMERDAKNAELGFGYNELGLRSALTEANNQNTFGIGRFEQQVNLEKTRAEQSDRRQRLLLDLLANPNVHVSPEQTDTITNSLFGSAGIPQASKPTAGPPTTAGARVGEMKVGSDGKQYIYTVDKQWRPI